MNFSIRRRAPCWVAIVLGSAVVGALLASGTPGAAEDSWMSNAWSGVASGTKRGWNTTVDLVTLKPIRRAFTKKPESNLGLGAKPMSRKTAKPASTGLFGSLFAPKPQSNPSTVEEFFSQERPR